MNSEVIGIIAGALSCTTFLPQVLKTWKSKSTKDVSLAMFLIAAAGSLDRIEEFISEVLLK